LIFSVTGIQEQALRGVHCSEGSGLGKTANNALVSRRKRKCA
jgi:hypothetical protein